MPAIADVVAGHVPLMFVDLGPSLGLIQAGKVRAVGVSTAKRVAALPDVPPVNDTVPDFDVASWQMVVAPAKTPRPIVDRLHAELKSLIESPEMSGADRQDRNAADADADDRRLAGVREIRDRALGQGGASGRHCGLAMRASVDKTGGTDARDAVRRRDAGLHGIAPSRRNIRRSRSPSSLPYAAGGNTDAIARTLAQRA